MEEGVVTSVEVESQDQAEGQDQVEDLDQVEGQDQVEDLDQGL